MLNLRSRLYARFDSLARSMIAIQRVLHEGFWLGLLDRQHLHQITQRQYLRWEHYRVADYNSDGLKSWEARAVEDYYQECKSILVGSAGGGREVVGLTLLGFRITAFECVHELSESCRTLLERKGLDAKVLTAKPDTVPERAGIHDGAIIGWGGYMHIPGRGARIAFLRQIHGLVRPGGPLLVSYITRQGDGRSLRWKAVIAQHIRRLRFSSESIEIGDSLDRTFDHRFTDSEVRSELKEAGFEAVFTAIEPYGHAVGLAKKTS